MIVGFGTKQLASRPEVDCHKYSDVGLQSFQMKSSGAASNGVLNEKMSKGIKNLKKQ